MLSAALNGQLLDMEFYIDPIFGFEVPTQCPHVSDDVLYPAKSWPSQKDYDDKYHQLAARFIENFNKYSEYVSLEVQGAGPKI
jgi:phosphoenolpyruvate carboxykinase (ATP)